MHWRFENKIKNIQTLLIIYVKIKRQNSYEKNINFFTGSKFDINL